jgi:hypothetical protein
MDTDAHGWEERRSPRGTGNLPVGVYPRLAAGEEAGASAIYGS